MPIEKEKKGKRKGKKGMGKTKKRKGGETNVYNNYLSSITYILRK